MLLSSLTLALTVFTSFPATLGQDTTSLAEVKKAFEAAHIPQNASLTFNPSTVLEVEFPQASGPPVRVKTGATLLINQTAIPPVFGVQLPEQGHPHGFGRRGASSLHDHDHDHDHDAAKFVVAMLDLDAPNSQDPIYAQIIHTLGGNYTLQQAPDRRGSGSSLLSNSTPVLVDYVQPAPSAGSGAHRYVFLLYNQPTGRAAQTLADYQFSYIMDGSIPIVAFFNISQFASETGLRKPIGGSYMLVGPDSTD